MIRQILFDFDGVIIDSMAVRDMGFRALVEEYDEKLIEEFIKYHRYNAGLSRFVKIRYFYEVMLGKQITDAEVNVMAERFSKIMKDRLVDKEVIISETVDFIKSIFGKIPMHIVSGSEEKELNYLCKALDIDAYFITIKGSPTPKKELVSAIMKKYEYDPKETLLIGDSINDYDAAKKSGLFFAGYNNKDLREVADLYLDTIDERIFGVQDVA